MIPSKPPEPLFFWPPTWSTWLKSFVAWSLARQPVPSSTDFEVSETPQGVSFRLRQEISDAIAAVVSNPHPWKLSTRYDSGTTTTYVSILPGSVNGLVPSNVFDEVALATESGSNFVNVDVVASAIDRNITAVSWDITSTAPAEMPTAENAVPTAFSVPIGVIKDGIVRNVEYDNLFYLADEAFRVPREAPSPLEEPFTRWWTWARTI